ncbi:alpha/beta hydrolase [Spiroplasma culicicola]|uniref:AB hydrolase-1 domain-containing protein n=1 Tax=Spiroplasma culicicola AES-1 TaxID=1276246 RepID=W6A892_9MOLU|nr:alpha/beta hydrolase [Spiroplasma culicicola]AHI53115.1 hypothetical protein SCULI_v1c07740 [Spiroplasma culicicola AES-1]
MNEKIMKGLIKVINSTNIDSKFLYARYKIEQILNLFTESLLTLTNNKKIICNQTSQWQNGEINGLKYIYHLNNKKTNKWIISLHGYRSSKESSALSAWMFDDLGYNILAFDFLNHGQSREGIVTLGVNELESLKTIVEEVINKFNPDQIGLIGFSMGAHTLNLFALTESKYKDKISFAISDSTYFDVHDVFAILLEANVPYLKVGFKKIVSNLIIQYKKDYNIDIDRYDINNLIEQKTSTFPILYIHSKKDLVTSYKDSQKFFDLRKTISSNDDILIFETGAHVQTQIEHTEEYLDKVKSFINDK